MSMHHPDLCWLSTPAGKCASYASGTNISLALESTNCQGKDNPQSLVIRIRSRRMPSQPWRQLAASKSLDFSNRKTVLGKNLASNQGAKLFNPVIRDR